MRKRILALFLALMMTTMLFPAEIAAAETEIEPKIPEGYSYYGETMTDEFGNTYYYVSAPMGKFGLADGYWIDVNGEPVELEEEVTEQEEGAVKMDVDRDTSALPSKYDSRENGLVTAVESQISGTCWAHATIAALESSAIKKGLADDTLDLSEYHMVWNSFNGYYEGIDDSQNDGYISQSMKNSMANGGNPSRAGYALSNFSGAIGENTLPLTSKQVDPLITEMGQKMTFANKYDREITVESIKSIPSTESALKQAVLDYGGLYFAFSSYSSSYSHITPSGESITTYYNATGRSDGGHAVELIGWDDNFSVDNFGQDIRPTHNGAWLLKNSWGTGWGNGGYFWMSYEEPSTYGATAVIAADGSDYEKVFFYDGVGGSTTVSATKAANVFVADEHVMLTKFSIGKEATGRYSLKIYRLGENAADPEKGELIYNQFGDLNKQRFIDITGSVELQKGEKFSVVLSGSSSYYTEGTGSTWKKLTSHEGESYLYKNGAWMDTHNSYNNVCIRVAGKVCCDSDTRRVDYVCPGFHTETRYSDHGTVDLPRNEGYTWVCSYNGESFDGTGVSHDMKVEAHCYPTNGTPAEDSACVTEYRCLFCGKEVRPSVERHESSRTVVPATEESMGYTEVHCSYCDYTERRDFKAYSGFASGSVNENIQWQFGNGKLSFTGLGEMPNLKSSWDASWSSKRYDADTVYVNEGITGVGNYNLGGCWAKKIVLADTVKTIGSYAFSDMYKLQEVNYGSGVTSLGTGAFKGCSALKEGVIPDSVTSVGYDLFSNCSGMKKLIVGEGVSDLDGAIYSSGSSNSHLEELSLPASLVYLDDYFFDGTGAIDQISVAEGNRYYQVKDGILFNKDGTELCFYPATKTDSYYQIPEEVTYLNVGAFQQNPYLVYLDMANCKVSYLYEHTVVGCSALKYLNLPVTLTDLDEDEAVANNGNLTAVFLPGSIRYISKDWLKQAGDYPTIYTDSETSSVVSMASNSGLTRVTGHSEHKYVVISGAAADCKTEGDRILACECGCVMHCNGTHCYEWVVDQKATCGEAGEKHRRCVICGQDAEEHTVIPATGKHRYSLHTENPATLATPANCKEAATYYYCCNNCGAIDKTRTVKSGSPEKHCFDGEHRYNNNGSHSTKCSKCGIWSKAAGCRWRMTSSEQGVNCCTSGLNHFVCDVCGGTTTVENGLTGAHVPGPKCTYNGDGTHSCTCAVCNQPMIVGCTWEKTSSETGKNCTVEGLDRYVCRDCGGKTAVPNGKFGSHLYLFGKCIHCKQTVPEDKCTCLCHKSGLGGAIWKAECRIYQLLGINHTCKCGKTHY